MIRRPASRHKNSIQAKPWEFLNSALRGSDQRGQSWDLHFHRLCVGPNQPMANDESMVIIAALYQDGKPQPSQQFTELRRHRGAADQCLRNFRTTITTTKRRLLVIPEHKPQLFSVFPPGDSQRSECCRHPSLSPIAGDGLLGTPGEVCDSAFWTLKIILGFVFHAKLWTYNSPAMTAS
ncbi:hypothetical protein BJX64DRAFT_190666 [Aspergillus heterothallicus]